MKTAARAWRSDRSMPTATSVPTPAETLKRIPTDSSASTHAPPAALPPPAASRMRGAPAARKAAVKAAAAVTYFVPLR